MMIYHCTVNRTVDEVLPKAIFDGIHGNLVLLGTIIVTAIVNLYFLIPVAVMGALFIFIRIVYLKTSKNIKRIEGIGKRQWNFLEAIELIMIFSTFQLNHRHSHILRPLWMDYQRCEHTTLKIYWKTNSTIIKTRTQLAGSCSYQRDRRLASLWMWFVGCLSAACWPFICSLRRMLLVNQSVWLCHRCWVWLAFCNLVR